MKDERLGFTLKSEENSVRRDENKESRLAKGDKMKIQDQNSDSKDLINLNEYFKQGG